MGLPRLAPLLCRATAVLVLASLAAACGGSFGGGRIGVATGFNVTEYQPGKRREVRAFSGEALLGGRRITRAYFDGAVGVLNVWGSWCGPCRREQRALEAIWREYRPRGVRFLGLNVKDFRGDARAYLDEFEVTYPSVYDPAASVAHKFRVIVAPVTFVLDRQGRIAAKIVGALRSEEDLTRLLDQELARP